MRRQLGLEGLQTTISAICETIAEAQLPSRQPARDGYADVSDFVVSSIREMPRPLGLGIHFVTWCFALAGVFYAGRLFPQNSGSARRKQWLRWRNHRLPILRDFVRFYESLATLALFSRPRMALPRA